MVLRDPTRKEGARRFQVPDGKPIETLDRTISLEMCGIFFHGHANYHTDKQGIREAGFADVVVGGRMTMAYVERSSRDNSASPGGEGAPSTSKFTNIVWPGEHITVRGVVTGPTAEDRPRTEAFLWIEKDDGTVAARSQRERRDALSQRARCARRRSPVLLLILLAAPGGCYRAPQSQSLMMQHAVNARELYRELGFGVTQLESRGMTNLAVAWG